MGGQVAMGLECGLEPRRGCYAFHVRRTKCLCVCHDDPSVLETVHIQIKPWVARRLDDKTRELGRAAVDAAIERLIIQALDASDEIERITAEAIASATHGPFIKR
jgi:hypothetical protein